MPGLGGAGRHLLQVCSAAVSLSCVAAGCGLVTACRARADYCPVQHGPRSRGGLLAPPGPLQPRHHWLADRTAPQPTDGRVGTQPPRATHWPHTQLRRTDYTLQPPSPEILHCYTTLLASVQRQTSPTCSFITHGSVSCRQVWQPWTGQPASQH